MKRSFLLILTSLLACGCQGSISNDSNGGSGTAPEGAFGGSGKTDSENRPALENTISDDRKDNEEEVAWAECGHPPGGEDQPFETIDNGSEA